MGRLVLLHERDDEPVDLAQVAQSYLVADVVHRGDRVLDGRGARQRLSALADPRFRVVVQAVVGSNPIAHLQEKPC
jgi:hypothetical protein